MHQNKNFNRLAVLGLLSLNIAIGISWIAYHNYQPKLLQYFKLTELNRPLFYITWLILTVVPGIAGFISDGLLQRRSKYFPIYLTGITVAAMTFMAVAVTVGFEQLIFLKPMVPVLIVIWLISMNMFHAPANALLKQMGETKQLPQMMAVLIIGLEGVYALEPIINSIIEALGASFTFVVGGILVAASGTWFYKIWNKDSDLVIPKKNGVENTNWNTVLLASISFGSLYGFVMSIMPVEINKSLSIIDGSFYTALILLIATILAFPFSRLSFLHNLFRSTFFGWIIGAVSIAAILSNSGGFMTYTAMVGLTVSLSLVSVSTFPLALQKLENRHLALGTGIFIGISEGFEGLYQILTM